MFSRIKTGVSAIVAILGALGVVSCNTCKDSAANQQGNATNKTECECLPCESEPAPPEYGAISRSYLEYCEKNKEMNFYADLCYSSISHYASLHNSKYDPNSDEISRLGKEFEDSISFAMAECCKSLKPKEMDQNEHYCVPKRITLFPDDNGPQFALGCEIYKGCIRDVILHKDGKNHPLCQTNDTQNENKPNAQDDVAAEPTSDQPHENE